MGFKEKLISIEKGISSLQYQSHKEEIVNSIIHGVGVFLGIVALVALIVVGNQKGDAWHIVSFSVFGSALIFLYLSSTLFHIVKNKKVKEFFRKCDYIGIFFLIAGTYTPITLIYLRGPWGWSLFGVVWFLALVGIIIRIFFPRKVELILAVIYVLMGWVILIAIKPAIEMIPPGAFKWLLAGGTSYTIGLIFLSWKKLPHHHALWHIFVLGGSTAHFFSLFFYI